MPRSLDPHRTPDTTLRAIVHPARNKRPKFPWSSLARSSPIVPPARTKRSTHMDAHPASRSSPDETPSATATSLRPHALIRPQQPTQPSSAPSRPTTHTLFTSTTPKKFCNRPSSVISEDAAKAKATYLPAPAVTHDDNDDNDDPSPCTTSCAQARCQEILPRGGSSATLAVNVPPEQPRTFLGGQRTHAPPRMSGAAIESLCALTTANDADEPFRRACLGYGASRATPGGRGWDALGISYETVRTSSITV
ncbi:uncharacterized protein B0H18DRAFT_1131106 [Fomitopsis serialis]|uniref:uncharacterized protein n=1 Tax=Fomitopsis serialis TaxID=139415 RepID=UPI00200842C5|nr:uncharacterized protein B0H18DRAFT_1131106 [Neoantrodia serialis]KAH9908810.1 hypothetical protein B0H18DRAFT_1131106 [Neoantrodia serialis]